MIIAHPGSVPSVVPVDSVVEPVDSVGTAMN